MLKTGKSVTVEHQHFDEDNNRTFVEITAHPGVDEEGQTTQVIHIAKDVTERKKVEETLIRARALETLSRSRLEALHRHATRLTSLSTIQAAAEYSFEMIEKIMGFNNGAVGVVEGDYLRFIYAKNFPADQLPPMPISGEGITIRAIKTGEPQLVNDTRLDPEFVSGFSASLSELAIPIKIGDKVVGVINLEDTKPNTYTEDDEKVLEIITEHLASAMINIQSQEKIKYHVVELERSNRDLDDYTYVVSHDLKAPLRTIKSFITFLMEDYGIKLDEKGNDYLERVSNAATNMGGLIEDLLLLSRVGRKFVDLEEVNLNELLGEIRCDQAGILQEGGASLMIGELPTLDLQRVWAKQLFSNLVNNGLKFNRSQHPVVEVSCTEDQGKFTFSVKDNGIGIDEGKIPQLFKIFVRLHSSEEFEGTGAGLAICKKVVEYFGGRIWIESRVGVGSTFFFTIPRRASKLLE
jgi:signal transduction histidine kinase